MNQSLDACLRTLERLEQYLDVLARFGYGDRASIVAFHPGYAAVTTWSLVKLLTVAGPLNDRAAAPDVASRAVRVYRRANAESLEYLVDRMPARIMDALNQRLFVMDMCLTLVRYVVEGQRLNDIRSLYDWDYAEAWGDKDYAGFRTIDDAERALIEDAFRRKNLAVLEGNPSYHYSMISVPNWPDGKCAWPRHRPPNPTISLPPRRSRCGSPYRLARSFADQPNVICRITSGPSGRRTVSGTASAAASCRLRGGPVGWI
ncbi:MULTISPECIES: hypothetical protein [unclassified Burkholderia]|uniref:hypothetical protein n=1 Tax=unclassified Burkholderia TaxID=2613784 RepID=UPI000F573AC7|nr:MULTISPECIES: hypothetical protein [unclassified Burkholderia]